MSVSELLSRAIIGFSSIFFFDAGFGCDPTGGSLGSFTASQHPKRYVVVSITNQPQRKPQKCTVSSKKNISHILCMAILSTLCAGRMLLPERNAE